MLGFILLFCIRFLDIFNVSCNYRNIQKFAIKEDTITSSRCVVVTENVGTTNAKVYMMLTLWNVTKTSFKKIDMDSGVFLFAPDFIFYEQYVIIVGQTIQISVIASGWILVVALVFKPNPDISVFVVLSVESTFIWITRFMIFWDVNLDPFSIIYLIISFGFSVNCSFHIAYGFNVLHNETSLNRLGLSFGVFGYPIVQSAISSVLGTFTVFAWLPLPIIWESYHISDDIWSPSWTLIFSTSPSSFE